MAYAYVARYPDHTTKLVVMDALIPGVLPWEQIVRTPALWHFGFGGKDALRLVKGHERIYLDRFWNVFAANPWTDEGTRVQYARLYAQPGAMRAAFAQFLSIRKDAEDNAESVKTRLTMPVLAIGGEKSFGVNEAAVMRRATTQVIELVVQGSGNWPMEEATDTTVKAVQGFLASPWTHRLVCRQRTE